ncbi:hypothetical protein MMC07_001754 [Pseudocyphellaria aurata]|nr:hypothetical protein [Pseudocyphellaria aurata]
MATRNFLALPAEIHINIAGHLTNSDLLITTRSRDILSLCLTSKLLNERCLCVLYRHVEMLFDPFGIAQVLTHDNSARWDSLYMRQRRFVQTLLTHPEYAKCVRSFKGMLCFADFDSGNGSRLGTRIEEDLWRAMQSLTHLQNVDVAFHPVFPGHTSIPKRIFPTALFQTTTSVRLVGYIYYGLSKSILAAINPAKLEHLFLDMVHDRKHGTPRDGFRPGDRGEDGRIIAFGATAGLLSMLTGQCTKLRTLVLRRIGQVKEGKNWRASAEDASYTEWATFIRSVRGTVEKFTFEQGQSVGGEQSFDTPRMMDVRFRRLIFPVFSSGPWPRLTVMELLGVREDHMLIKKAMAGLAENAKVVLEQHGRDYVDTRELRRWN